jgi:hypothetical protein
VTWPATHARPYWGEDKDALGEAVQIVPVNSALKPLGTKCLNLKFDKQLSNFAFNFNVRR